MRGAITATRLSHTGTTALVILAVIAVGVTLHMLAAIIGPLVMAVFLLIVIEEFSRLIRRTFPRIPRAVATAVSLCLIAASFGLMFWVVFENLSQLAGDYRRYVGQMTENVRAIQTRLGLPAGLSVSPTVQDIQITPIVRAVAGWLQSALWAGGLVLIYLAFMMASRRAFKRKVLAVAGTRATASEANSLFEFIRSSVSRYVWVQTVTGLMIAALSLIVLIWLDVPQPVFWSFLIFISSYVPIVGGVVGVLAPVLFSLSVSQDFNTPLLLFLTLQTIQLTIGNVVQPRMQGSSLNIDPIAVLLSLALWGTILGPVGAFLSTPLTVVLMVILAQHKSTLWIAILLSENARPAVAGGDAPIEPAGQATAHAPS